MSSICEQDGKRGGLCLSSDVLILVDGVSLTSNKFDASHPVVLYYLMVYFITV